MATFDTLAGDAQIGGNGDVVVAWGTDANGVYATSQRVDFTNDITITTQLQFDSEFIGGGMTFAFHNDPRGATAHGGDIGAHSIENAVVIQLDTYVNSPPSGTDYLAGEDDPRGPSHTQLTANPSSGPSSKLTEAELTDVPLGGTYGPSTAIYRDAIVDWDAASNTLTWTVLGVGPSGGAHQGSYTFPESGTGSIESFLGGSQAYAAITASSGGIPGSYGVASGSTTIVETPLPPLDYIVEGTSGNDVIDVNYTGDPEGDRVDANDNQFGNNNDSIVAGAGNDTVFAGGGDDTVDGGTGADSIDGGTGNNTLSGGDGDDVFTSVAAVSRAPTATFDAGLTGWTDVNGTPITATNVLDDGNIFMGNFIGFQPGTNNLGEQIRKEFAVEAGDSHGVFEFDFLKLDSWDENSGGGVNERFGVYLDGTLVFEFTPDGWGTGFGDGADVSSTFNAGGFTGSYSVTSSGADVENFGATGTGWGERGYQVRIELDNPGTNPFSLGIGTNIHDASDDESWGIDNVNFASTDDPNLDFSNPTGLTGWTDMNGTPITATNVLDDGNFFMGNFEGFQPGTNNLGEQIRKDFTVEAGDSHGVFEFDFLKLDSWNEESNERFGVYLDGTLVFEFTPDGSGSGFGDGADVSSTFSAGGFTGSYSVTSSGADVENFGAATSTHWGERAYQVRIELDNPGTNPFSLGIGTNLNFAADDESWGIDNVNFASTNDPNLDFSNPTVPVSTADVIDGGVGADTYQSPGADQLTVAVNSDGDGTAVENGIATDTLTSVETYIANEAAGQIDEITITNSAAGTDAFVTSDVSGLDDTAVGTFTPTNGGAVINFGPTEAVQLSDVLLLSGTVQITSGDETGTVGGISFENFETINFDLINRNYIVEGDGTDNLIDTNYTGDPEGDLVDAGDNLAGNDDDSITAGAGNDTVFAGDGDDTVLAGDGDDTVDGGDGADSLIGGAGSDNVSGGAGDDFINTRTTPGLGAPDQGMNYPDDTTTPADENVDYSYLADTDPNNDRDSVDGGIGNDTILTGDDNDTIVGGAGDDRIDAGFDDDTVTGGTGADLIQGNQGADTLDGGDGDDTLYGGLSPLDPNFAADALFSLENDGATTGLDPNPTDNSDVFIGGAGNDQIFGGDDNDTLQGGADNDLLDGGIDNDVLEGGDGLDTLLGGHGNDTLDGGAGNDVLTGGDGFDTFVTAAGEGQDTITDFGAGSGDIDDGDQSNNDFIDLSQFYNATTLDAVNNSDTDPNNDFLHELAVLRADAADGTIDGTVNGVDFSTEIGDVDLVLQNGGSAVASTDLTFDTTNVVCFCRGTKVSTRQGYCAVEDLEIGDQVVTRDNGYKTIRWIGKSIVDAQKLQEQPRLRPIVFEPDSLGVLFPSTTLRVSPQHRILLQSPIVQRMFETKEVLIPAVKLTDADGITVDTECTEVEYYHIMFDSHEIIMADGAWAESLYLGDQAMNALSNEARQEIFDLFPEFEDPENRPKLARPAVESRRKIGVLLERTKKNAKTLY